MSKPSVSVIIPVYNSAEYLCQCLDSLLKQTYKDFEIICVDDGSKDNSLEILNEYAKKHKKIKVFTQENKFAGAARNRGIEESNGQYLMFLDSDDYFEKTLLEKTYFNAVENSADIVAFNYRKFDKDGNFVDRIGIHHKWLNPDKKVFSYRDCPDLIMSVVNPTPWNKLYNASFVKSNNLKFEEISSTNDITFAAVSVANANRVSYLTDYLVNYRVHHNDTITSTKSKNLNNVIVAVRSALRQVKELPYYDKIRKSAAKFMIENYIFSLDNYVKDFDSDIAREFYTNIHNDFNLDEFMDIYEESIPKSLLKKFKVIQNYEYETVSLELKKKRIVSFTTIANRIQFVPQIVENIESQTVKAHEIILWLSKEDFPNKLKDIPEDVIKLKDEKRISIKWVSNLKPHKKYFYAMQKYPNDLIITIDDDLKYDLDMIENLFNSYLLHQDSVSTCRAHLITFDKRGKFMPYSNWLKEYNLVDTPCMQLIATGGAGALYPCELFAKYDFNEEVVIENSLLADDLWLKALEVVLDIPVVLVKENKLLSYIENSQDDRLFDVNQTKNDEQLDNIINYWDSIYGKNHILNSIKNSKIGINVGYEEICQYINQTQSTLYRKNNAYNRLERNRDETKEKLLASQKEIKKYKNKYNGISKSKAYKLAKFLQGVKRKIIRK